MAERNPSGNERPRKVRIPVNGKTKDEAEAPVEAERETTPAPDEEITEGADWRDRYLRLAADLENTKKRLERIHSDRALMAQERLLRDLLPLADNLERALAHASPAEQQSSLYSGIELTLKEFLATLKKHGVRRIEALGEPFDPELHEAIGSGAHPTLAPGTIMHVELPGYTFNGRLLRPARVLVVAG